VKVWDARPTKATAIPGSNPATAEPPAIVTPMPAARSRELTARPSQSRYNLKQIGLALRDFQSRYNHFPADVRDRDGKPMLSWRVRLLPFLDEQELFDALRLDEPWDSPQNKFVLEQMPQVFAWPERPAQPGPGMTCYRGFSGKRTVFDPGLKEGVGIETITDGTPNTIAVVWAKDAVPWTKPDSDIPFEDEAKPERMQALLGELFIHYPGGFDALYCDGSVRYIRSNVNLLVLRALVTRDGGEIVIDAGEVISADGAY
jgi:hypothetical protein